MRGEQKMPEGVRYKVLCYLSAALVLGTAAALTPATAQFPPAPEDQPAAKGKKGAAAAAPSMNGNWSGQLTQVGSHTPYKFELAINARGAQTKHPDLDCTVSVTSGGSSTAHVVCADGST